MSGISSTSFSNPSYLYQTQIAGQVSSMLGSTSSSVTSLLPTTPSTPTSSFSGVTSVDQAAQLMNASYGGQTVNLLA